MTCAFFGNRYINETDAESQLWEKIIYMVEHVGVKTFYVGNQGAFDFLVRKQLIKLQKIYPFIKYYVVLAYLPKVKKENNEFNNENSFLPDGIELCPPKFAIDKRNRWLIENSDYLITYIETETGCAGKYKKIAINKGKHVIELNIKAKKSNRALGLTL